MSASILVVDNISAGYDNTRLALKDMAFSAALGEFVCLLGPSGCGKTTMLNIVAGFLRPVAGTVSFDGLPVKGPRNNIGIVFQQHALFPWLTARQNVEFPLRWKRIKNGQGANRSLTAEERRSMAEALLGRAHIAIDTHSDRYPDELSGGEQQRVAIARTLAADPALMLMDEPFGSLDAQTRMRMQDWLLRTWESDRRTVIFVTHDIEEAILLADRIVVMSDSPGTVKDEFAVRLPRPRSPAVRSSSYVSELRMRISLLLMNSSPGNF